MTICKTKVTFLSVDPPAVDARSHLKFIWRIKIVKEPRTAILHEIQKYASAHQWTTLDLASLPWSVPILSTFCWNPPASVSWSLLLSESLQIIDNIVLINPWWWPTAPYCCGPPRPSWLPTLPPSAWTPALDRPPGQGALVKEWRGDIVDIINHDNDGECWREHKGGPQSFFVLPDELGSCWHPLLPEIRRQEKSQTLMLHLY